MTRRIHVLTGEFPPARGGIAAFCDTLASGLAAEGAEVNVWAPAGSRSSGEAPIALHALPDHFGRALRTELESTLRPGDIVLLQYVPNALGARGANLAFCRWLLARSRRGWDVRVMFHEPFMYFGWQSPGRNLLALVHRAMAVLLLRAAHIAYVSTPAWEPLLRPYAPRALRFAWVPVPSAVPVVSDEAAVRHQRARLGDALVVGHFSSYPADVRPALRAALNDVLQAHRRCTVLCIGRGSTEFARSLPADSRVHASGELDLHDVSVAIQACDLFVQPYPDGATARRTSLATLLAHGACVVTTTGRYTENLWTRRDDVVALAPAGHPGALRWEVARLAGNRAARTAQAANARAFYERHLSPGHAVRAVLQP